MTEETYYGSSSRPATTSSSSMAEQDHDDRHHPEQFPVLIITVVVMLVFVCMPWRFSLKSVIVKYFAYKPSSASAAILVIFIVLLMMAMQNGCLSFEQIRERLLGNSEGGCPRHVGGLVLVLLVMVYLGTRTA